MTVSIILPTFNGASRGYLDKAIKSVLDQTYSNFELIIIDDGSTDNTKEVCQPYLLDKRVLYYYQVNKGLSAARNSGIKLAKYEYLSFLDDDDLFHRDKIKKQVNLFNKSSNPSLGLVYTFLEIIDTKDLCIEFQGKPPIKNTYEKLFYGNAFFAPSSVMIKKKVFDHIGLFDEALLSCEDYDLWFRLSKDFEIDCIKEYLTLYRKHSNSLSRDLEKLNKYRVKVLEKALNSASKKIKDKKNEFYFLHYMGIAAAYLVANEFGLFRKYYYLALNYGKVTLQWKIKYYLSYFPFIYQLKRSWRPI